MEARKFLITNLLSKNRHTLTPENIISIVNKCEGYSGADIHSLCSEAALGPIREIASRGSQLNSIHGIAKISEHSLRPIMFRYTLLFII